MEFIITLIFFVCLYLAFKDRHTIEDPVLSPSLPDHVLFEHFLLAKAQYFKSAVWRAKRSAVLARDHHRCSSCGTYQNLTVHHDHGYGLIPDEPISDLRTLCRRCHTAFHHTHGFPQSYRDYITWDTRGIPFTTPLLKVTHEQDQTGPTYTSRIPQGD